LENLTLGKIILILILLVYLSFVTRRLKYGIPRSWKLKLGVYWDKSMNPYCVIHKIPLSRAASSANASSAFHCSKCHEDIHLHGVPHNYSLEEAIKKIEKNEI
jgi:hypothetical protein